MGPYFQNEDLIRCYELEKKIEGSTPLNAPNILIELGFELVCILYSRKVKKQLRSHTV